MVCKSIDPYALCFCGSGKKFRFCCGAKHEPVVISEDDHKKGQQLLEEGLKYFDKRDFKKAIPLFEKSRAIFNVIPSAANNLARVYLLTGDLKSAIDIQRESFKESPLPNIFGICNMANMMLMQGDEDGAKNAVDIVLRVPFAEEYTLVRLFEILAHMRRHQDIINIGEASPFDGEYLNYYMGIAAANLGDRSRAINCLNRMSLSCPMAAQAVEYAQLLRAEKSAQTIRGNWPYFTPADYQSMAILDEKTSKLDRETLAKVKNSRYFVDFVESLINEGLYAKMKPKHLGRFLALLSECSHPEAEEFLRAIAVSEKVPESLRLEAAMTLSKRGGFSNDV